MAIRYETSNYSRTVFKITRISVDNFRIDNPPYLLTDRNPKKG